jgi:DNA-binding NarL/FixJ family response regulator
MARRIFIVDDHPIMRRGYASLIGREPDLEICSEAGSAVEALSTIGNCSPDLAIIDISLGGMNGLELIKQLLAQRPHLLILVVSMHDESLYAERVLAAGAKGYIMKSVVDRTVIDAIRRILTGGYFVSEKMSSRFLSQLGGRRTAASPRMLVANLSDRELEVFELLGHGRTTAEIASALTISPKTVETHRARIKEKLGVATGRELLLYAVRWVERDDMSSSEAAG